jgi:hypothetical protein
MKYQFVYLKVRIFKCSYRIYNYIYTVYIYTSTSGIVEKDCLEVILVVSSGNVQ